MPHPWRTATLVVQHRTLVVLEKPVPQSTQLPGAIVELCAMGQSCLFFEIAKKTPRGSEKVRFFNNENGYGEPVLQKVASVIPTCVSSVFDCNHAPLLHLLITTQRIIVAFDPIIMAHTSIIIRLTGEIAFPKKRNFTHPLHFSIKLAQQHNPTSGVRSAPTQTVHINTIPMLPNSAVRSYCSRKLRISIRWGMLSRSHTPPMSGFFHSPDIWRTHAVRMM